MYLYQQITLLLPQETVKYVNRTRTYYHTAVNQFHCYFVRVQTTGKICEINRKCLSAHIPGQQS